jgi:hypothetical protein
LSTVEITYIRQEVAKSGRVAGSARKETEKELGRSVISSENFLGYDSAEALPSGE